MGWWNTSFVGSYVSEETALSWLRWIEHNPSTFIYYVILCLSPFLALSAFLSWKLSKEVQKETKEKKMKESRTKAILARDRGSGKESQAGKPSGFEVGGGDASSSSQVKHKKKKKG